MGEGHGLAILVFTVDTASVFPRSRSPIFGKSLRVGAQNCKRVSKGKMINKRIAKVRNTKITAKPSDETSISRLTTN